jgi:hypothetical protein
MGRLIQSNDPEISSRYGREVDGNRLLGLVEDWSFPTYVRDARPTTDFSLPRSLLLSRTAVEVLHEIDAYNDAYLHYLTTVYLPRALKRDPTFGLKISDLSRKIAERVEGVEEPATRRACEVLLQTIR